MTWMTLLTYGIEILEDIAIVMLLLCVLYNPAHDLQTQMFQVQYTIYITLLPNSIPQDRVLCQLDNFLKDREWELLLNHSCHPGYSIQVGHKANTGTTLVLIFLPRRHPIEDILSCMEVGVGSGRRNIAKLLLHYCHNIIYL